MPTYVIKQRGDTAENWEAANPVLAEREVGWVLDSEYLSCKIGDGLTPWKDLPVRTGPPGPEGQNTTPLSDSVSSASSGVAASSKAVKKAYDMGVTAKTVADSLLPAPTPDDAGKALVVGADGSYSWQPVASDPIGIPKWYFGTTPPAGHVDLSNDNGLLLRSAYPGAWAEIESMQGAVRPEAEWQAQFAEHGMVGFFSAGDGETNFRVPLMRRGFIRAPDAASGLAVGDWQGDAIREIQGFAGYIDQYGGATGPFSHGTETGGMASGAASTRRLEFIASKVVPTADENRPVNICLLPIMRMHHAVVNAASLVLEEFVQQVNGKLDVSRYEADRVADAPFAIRAVGVFDVVATPPKKIYGKNFSSIVRTGTGVFSVTFDTPIYDYTVVGVAGGVTSAMTSTSTAIQPYNVTPTGFSFTVTYSGGLTNGFTAHLVVIGGN